MAVSASAGAQKGTGFVIGMSGSNPSATNAILKEFYIPAVRDLLNSKTVLLKYVRKNTEDVDGMYAVIPLNTGRNEAVIHVAEGARLPDPKTQTHNRARYNVRYYYGRIKFSGPGEAATKTGRGSFLRLMDSEVTGLARDMVRELNRVAFGDGSGRLATVVTTGGGGSTITVNNPGGFASTDYGTHYLRAGMDIAIIDVATFTVNDVTTITAVNYDTNVITVNPVVAATAVGDYVVRIADLSSTAVNDTSYMKEPFGLHACVNDVNPFGGGGPATNWVGELDRTTVTPWNSFVIDNGGSPFPFSMDVFQQLQDGIDKLGDGTVQCFLTTHGIRRAYLNELTANKRFPKTMELDGGFRVLEYNEIPVIPDRDCTRGYVYALDFDVLQWFLSEDFSFMDKDGSYLHRMPDEDAYQATLYRYHQFGTDAPNRLGRCEDIIDD